MEKLKFREKLCYGIGGFGENLIYLLVSGYLMFFYTDIFGIDPVVIGVIFLIARIWDAVNDFLMGTIIDNTRSKYGRCRPYLLTGGFFVIISTVLCFTTFDGPKWGQITYIFITYIMWGMAYTAFDIPYFSMIPSLARKQDERTKLAAYPRVLGFAGSLLGGMLLMPLVKGIGRGNDALGYQVTSMIFGIVFLLCIIICFKNTHEKVEVQKRDKIKLKRMLEIVMSNTPLKIIIAVTIIAGVFIMLRTALFMHYIKYYIGNEMLAGLFNVTMGIASIVGIFIITATSSKIEKKKALICSILTSIIGMVGFYFSGKSIVPLVIFHMVTSAGFGGLTVLSSSILADTVEYGEWKCGERVEGIIFSAQSFATKFTVAVSGAISAFGLKIIGFEPNIEQSPQVLDAFRIMMSILPVIGLLLCFIPIRKYKLDSKMYNIIIDELKERRSENK